MEAVEQRRKADDISAVLYPNDATEYGKELRLKQQVFFVSASIQVRPPLPFSIRAGHACKHLRPYCHQVQPKC